MSIVYYKCPRTGQTRISLTRTVAAMVIERGAATADDLHPLLDGYSRQQVLNALQNAKNQGLLSCDGHVPRRGNGVGSGSVCATYRPPCEVADVAVAPMARISSVFQLGTV